MKQPLGVIVTAAMVGLAPFTAYANATERKASSKAPAAAVKKSTSPSEDASPRGDTHVHRFFQAWGNGMDRGVRAIGLDKDPLAGRLPDHRSRHQGANHPHHTGNDH